MRDDVRQFAELMSSMMDYKEDAKGPIEQDYPLTKALMNMQAQWRKLEENPMPQGDDFRRIMVHVANFAMIAFQISLGDRGASPQSVQSSTPARCSSLNPNGTRCGLFAGHEGQHRLGHEVVPW